MQCKKCHRSWDSDDNKVYLFCPFCQEPLIDVPEDIGTLDTALKYLTSHFGTTIIEDKKIVLKFVDTFLPGKKRERNFLNMAYAGGLVKSVLATVNDTDEKQRAFVRQAIEQMQESYGISEEWSNYIINSVASSLGIESHNMNSKIQKKIKAESGNPEAQFSLSLEYFDNEDIENYIYWIQLAIKNGSKKALFHYGRFLFQQQDRHKEGLQLLLNSAASGYMDSICYLAKQIKELPADIQKKIIDIVGKTKITYELLSVQQLIDLSFYYQRQSDLDKAVFLAEKGFEKDPTISWQRYTNLLKLRSDIRDQITVGKIYRQIAEKGNIDAIKALAEYIENKASSLPDEKTALYWYKMAADAGDVSSQLRLAKVYETGKHGIKDLSKAVEWYEIAAANGSQEAYQKISYKSPGCIRKTVSLIMEDDSILECDFQGYLPYRGNDYLIITDPESKESIPLLYREIGKEGDFEVELLDEAEEKDILQAFWRK